MVKVGHETAFPSASEQSSSLPGPELVPRCVAGAGERNITALLADAATWLSPGRIDYVSIVDADDLQPITNGTRRALVAVAELLSEARLIDNGVLGVGWWGRWLRFDGAVTIMSSTHPVGTHRVENQASPVPA